jgi:hypothetical protein
MHEFDWMRNYIEFHLQRGKIENALIQLLLAREKYPQHPRILELELCFAQTCKTSLSNEQRRKIPNLETNEK